MYGLLSLQIPVDELVRGLLFFLPAECHDLYKNGWFGTAALTSLYLTKS